MPRLVTLLLLAAGLAAAPARAALGESLAALQKRFGRPEPQVQRQKNVAIWSIESAPTERLIYTVTFNDQGHSIAEGLKPSRSAILTDDYALSFVQDQLAAQRDTHAMLTPKPGEAYFFAGQRFTCGPAERVWVDPTADFLIVWSKGPQAYVMAVRAEMLAKVN